MDASTNNNIDPNVIEGDTIKLEEADAQPIINEGTESSGTPFMNDDAMNLGQQPSLDQHLPVKRKLDDEDIAEVNPVLTTPTLPETTLEPLVQQQPPQLESDSNQVVSLKDQLLQQQQEPRISKKSKLLRRHTSGNATPYSSNQFPPNKIVTTNPPMLLSYRKKWIDITKHIQSNYKSLNKKERKRVVHDLFSDSLHMGKLDIMKEGEGWSGGYNISGVRRGDMGNGVSQLLSQGFLRL